jgi:hypothetical protein
MKLEEKTTKYIEDEAASMDLDDIPTFAKDPKTCQQRIGRYRVCYKEGTYLTKCCGPEHLSEMFLRTDENEEHLCSLPEQQVY